MFWFTREKVANDVAAALVPIMQAVFRGTGRTDPQLFSNPFLCGFLAGSCFALASVFSGRRLEPRDKDTFRCVSSRSWWGRSDRSQLITRSSI